MVRVTWEVWPSPIKGTQGDPITRSIRVDTIQCAVNHLETLKQLHGKNLRIVDMTILLYKGL